MSNDPDPLLTMLQGAGLTNISAADLASLPTWEKLTQQYGDFSKGPMIVGMESCERYRQQVAQRRRYAAPGGMFNTGTNAAAFHLEHNLKAAQKWQLPWGKHREAKVRLSHTASGFDKAIKEDVMPIVMIRDPLHWMQSMVRTSILLLLMLMLMLMMLMLMLMMLMLMLLLLLLLLLLLRGRRMESFSTREPNPHLSK
jgi:hypothetical protein